MRACLFVLLVLLLFSLGVLSLKMLDKSWRDTKITTLMREITSSCKPGDHGLGQQPWQSGLWLSVAWSHAVPTITFVFKFMPVLSLKQCALGYNLLDFPFEGDEIVWYFEVSHNWWLQVVFIYLFIRSGDILPFTIWRCVTYYSEEVTNTYQTPTTCHNPLSFLFVWFFFSLYL